MYDKIDKHLQKQKALLDVYSCSILTDGWTKKAQSVTNLCVHSKLGAYFIKFVEDSNQPHIREYIFMWVDDCIKEIKKQSVIQVVSYNAFSNMSLRR